MKYHIYNDHCRAEVWMPINPYFSPIYVLVQFYVQFHSWNARFPSFVLFSIFLLLSCDGVFYLFYGIRATSISLVVSYVSMLKSGTIVLAVYSCPITFTITENSNHIIITNHLSPTVRKANWIKSNTFNKIIWHWGHRYW